MNHKHLFAKLVFFILSVILVACGTEESSNDLLRTTDAEVAEIVVSPTIQPSPTPNTLATRAADWRSAFDAAEIDGIEREYAYTAPQRQLVANNRIEAFTQTHDFLDAFTVAIEDDWISEAELAEISQLAVNAEASLYNIGDPELIKYARQIDALARVIYRGEWVEASEGAAELKLLLPARPRP